MVSIVMFCSCSSSSASSRNEYSNSIPSASHAFLICSTLPSGNELVS